MEGRWIVSDSLNYRNLTKMTLAEFPHFSSSSTNQPPVTSYRLLTIHTQGIDISGGYVRRRRRLLPRLPFRWLKLIKIQLLKRRLVGQRFIWCRKNRFSSFAVFGLWLLLDAWAIRSLSKTKKLKNKWQIVETERLQRINSGFKLNQHSVQWWLRGIYFIIMFVLLLQIERNLLVMMVYLSPNWLLLKSQPSPSSEIWFERPPGDVD